MSTKIKRMIFRSSIVVVLLSMLFITGIFQNDPDTRDKEKVILEGVMKFLDIVHFSPKEIDDEFSLHVYNKYLDNLDPGKRFFILEDLIVLEPFKLSIDDEVLNKELAFFDASVEVIENAVKRANDIYDEISKLEFDFTKDEYIDANSDDKPFAKDIEELKDQWRLSIKYDILTRYYRELEEQEFLADESKKLSEKEIMEKVVDRSRKTFNDWFKRLEKERRSDRFGVYLNAIANYFDPHTDYFSPKEKQDFDINMGGKLIGIGARLTFQDDYTKVASIVPGGPAWKVKNLEVDDLILKVRQEGEEEALDVKGMRLDDVVLKIRGKKGSTVYLTVQKKDGTVKNISIVRDEVVIDESFARSLILEVPGVIENIGYIKLPKFYSSFEKEDGNSCAQDVARELEKLKSENVNGVILDLRNNTGGSLQDVITMSGLFIEDGPIVQVKPRGRSAYVHKDNDKSVQYAGPLIILVNDFSASASEILAAALQDYGRAVIVGSKSTYGKGTVQRFYDLDRAFSGNIYKPLGELKVTVQKFYRINGGSTQLKGVESDIVLPDNYYFLETGEKDYTNAMEWSEIDKVDYGQNVVELKNIHKLKEKSAERVSQDENFSLMIDNAMRLKENRAFSKFPLHQDTYFDLMKNRKEESKKFDILFENDLENWNVKNLTADEGYLLSDESRTSRNTEWLKDVQKDFYLFETMQIMRDMIELEPSFANIEMVNKKSTP